MLGVDWDVLGVLHLTSFGYALIVIVIYITVFVALVLVEDTMTTLDASFALVVCAPLVMGVLFGRVVRRRGWPYPCLFFTVPFVATISVSLYVYLLDMAWRIVGPQRWNDSPLCLQSLGAVWFVVPALFLYGTLPALAGYLLASAVPLESPSASVMDQETAIV